MAPSSSTPLWTGRACPDRSGPGRRLHGRCGLLSAADIPVGGQKLVGAIERPLEPGGLVEEAVRLPFSRIKLGLVPKLLHGGNKLLAPLHEIVGSSVKEQRRRGPFFDQRVRRDLSDEIVVLQVRSE